MVTLCMVSLHFLKMPNFMLLTFLKVLIFSHGYQQELYYMWLNTILKLIIRVENQNVLKSQTISSASISFCNTTEDTYSPGVQFPNIYDWSNSTLAKTLSTQVIDTMGTAWFVKNSLKFLRTCSAKRS